MADELTPDAHAGSRGLFITLEGVDGAGKSTQCALLREALEACGREVVCLREPGGTRIGEAIREQLLLNPDMTGMDPLCELLLFEAARRQLVAQVIEPALTRGCVVLSDRFFDSTTAYQGFARGLGEQVVAQANALACAGLAPDRTILLDLPCEAAFGRAAARDGATDRMEREGEGFQELVHAGFEHVARQSGGRVVRVDASGEPAEVAARVRAALADLMDLGGAR